MLKVNNEASYVIHCRNYREHALLVDLFTLDYGRISAVAGGSVKQAATWRAELRPYKPIFVDLVRGNSQLWRLKAAISSKTQLAMPMPLQQQFCAEYLNELLYRLYKTEDADSQLFSSYTKTVSALPDANAYDTWILLREFERELLRSLGYSLPLNDIHGSAFNDDKLYAYSPREGFYECEEPSVQKYPGRVLKSALQKDCFDKTDSCFLGVLKQLHGTIIDELLEHRPLNSRNLYQEFIVTTHLADKPENNS